MPQTPVIPLLLLLLISALLTPPAARAADISAQLNFQDITYLDVFSGVTGQDTYSFFQGDTIAVAMVYNQTQSCSILQFCIRLYYPDPSNNVPIANLTWPFLSDGQQQEFMYQVPASTPPGGYCLFFEEIYSCDSSSSTVRSCVPIYIFPLITVAETVTTILPATIVQIPLEVIVISGSTITIPATTMTITPTPTTVATITCTTLTSVVPASTFTSISVVTSNTIIPATEISTVRTTLTTQVPGSTITSQIPETVTTTLPGSTIIVTTTLPPQTTVVTSQYTTTISGKPSTVVSLETSVILPSTVTRYTTLPGSVVTSVVVETEVSTASGNIVTLTNPAETFTILSTMVSGQTVSVVQTIPGHTTTIVSLRHHVETVLVTQKPTSAATPALVARPPVFGMAGVMVLLGVLALIRA